MGLTFVQLYISVGCLLVGFLNNSCSAKATGNGNAINGGATNGNASNGNGNITGVVAHHTILQAHTESHLYNLTINWTIDNFLFLLEEPEIRSPSVSSEIVGLTDADGDWHLILIPKKTINLKDYVSLNVERANATFGNVTGRFGFYVLDKRGNEVVSVYDEATNIFTAEAPDNTWGYDKFLPHTTLLSVPAHRRPLVDGGLVIRAAFTFVGPITASSVIAA